MKKLTQWMPSWVWIIVVAALAQGVLAFSNRDVYSKSEVDHRVKTIEDKIDWLHQDVRDIKRMLGGQPRVDPRSDHHSSQHDEGQ